MHSISVVVSTLETVSIPFVIRSIDYAIAAGTCVGDVVGGQRHAIGSIHRDLGPDFSRIQRGCVQSAGSDSPVHGVFYSR